MQSTQRQTPVLREATAVRPWHRWARRLVLGSLAGLTHGALRVWEAGQAQEFGGKAPGPEATVTVHDPRGYLRVLLRGTIGAGEAYMHGEMDCDDPTALVRLFVRNRAVMNRMEGGLALLRLPLTALGHALNRNSRSGSRRNIAAHYDLGNDFYEQVLDRETMMYSGAIFPHADAGLAEAQRLKLARICEKLELGPDDHVLEIGSGWGGFALYAARHRGCRVTTTTISPAQYEYTRARVADAGLQDRITVLNRDYRDLDGQYDKLVSIEMIEAVGHRFHGTFFAQCSRLLKPHGTMLLQAITIADEYYAEYKRSVDFIQAYIFPGGCLPSIGAMAAAVARHTDLRALHLEDIGPHYATTLRHWRQRLEAHADDLRAQGFSETFLRMWRFYLCYCEGGFLERSIGNAQLLLAKPEARRASLAPSFS